MPYLNKEEQILLKLFELLSEDNLYQVIDIKLDAAIDGFKMGNNIRYSHKTFHSIIAHFIQHVYEHGLRVPRKLSFSMAHAEAISILEEYKNEYYMGYDAAILDASNLEINGIGLVIQNMGEIIKKNERDKYINWVLIKVLDSQDWESKTLIVELFIKIFKRFLPASLLEYDPGLLANNCHKLFFTEIVTNKLLQKISSSNPLFDLF